MILYGMLPYPLRIVAVQSKRCCLVVVNCACNRCRFVVVVVVNQLLLFFVLDLPLDLRLVGVVVDAFFAGGASLQWRMKNRSMTAARAVDQRRSSNRGIQKYKT